MKALAKPGISYSDMRHSRACVRTKSSAGSGSCARRRSSGAPRAASSGVRSASSSRMTALGSSVAGRLPYVQHQVSRLRVCELSTQKPETFQFS
jgi:hypothetical protein